MVNSQHPISKFNWTGYFYPKRTISEMSVCKKTFCGRRCPCVVDRQHRISKSNWTGYFYPWSRISEMSVYKNHFVVEGVRTWSIVNTRSQNWIERVILTPDAEFQRCPSIKTILWSKVSRRGRLPKLGVWSWGKAHMSNCWASKCARSHIKIKHCRLLHKARKEHKDRPGRNQTHRESLWR